ncbi:hypothetical protein HPB52_005356 [Rhipicephalus sanguineus]|uniref:CS domain-containing protein n=1 Tax=Rhipicephalus sanguineus TaxID=34632 RepID=A0A9D4QCC3_RHISA|nr:hypothetical protein HPB52_005356 [Rhipicephalus sanguineus]
MVKRDPSIDWQQLEKVEGSPSLPSSDEELKDENPTVELVGLKYDYYKSGASGDTVTGTLFVKSISKEALAMDFDERGLLVKFHTKNTNTEFLKQHGASEETTFTWRVNVKEAIRPEDCRCRLSPCKLELVLKKKVPSRWSSLELAPPAKKIVVVGLPRAPDSHFSHSCRGPCRRAARLVPVVGPSPSVTARRHNTMATRMFFASVSTAAERTREFPSSPLLRSAPPCASPVGMALFEHLSVFLELPGPPPVPWTNWKKIFQAHLEAAGGNDWNDARRASALVSLLGREGQRKYFAATEQEEALTTPSNAASVSKFDSLILSLARDSGFAKEEKRTHACIKRGSSRELKARKNVPLSEERMQQKRSCQNSRPLETDGCMDRSNRRLRRRHGFALGIVAFGELTRWPASRFAVCLDSSQEKWPGGIESSDKRDICNFNRFYEFISDYIFKHIWWLHHFWRVRNVV